MNMRGIEKGLYVITEIHEIMGLPLIRWFSLGLPQETRGQSWGL